MGTKPDAVANADFPVSLGKWNLTRDVSSGERFLGSARLEQIGDSTLRLEEAGRLELPDGTFLPASRSWLWEFASANQLDILYDEEPPRLYHSLKLKREDGTLFGVADHVCGDDLYHGTYEIGMNLIKTCQTVKGPAKDYEVTSVYSK